MKFLVRSYLVNLVSLWVTAQYVGGFQLAEGLKSLLLVGLGFTFLHIVIKPILGVFIGPINFLTLGAIGLLVDALIIYLLALYFPQVTVAGWNFAGFSFAGFLVPAYSFNVVGTTIVSAFIINLIRTVLLALAS